MTVYDDIRYEVDDPVATITLDRPDHLNAWTPNMDGELRDAVRRAAADRSVVGIVITGAGRAFCAGADLSLLRRLADGESVDADDDTPSWAGNTDDFGGRFTYLLGVDKPVIAAVPGAVAGMAYPLALCCDRRVVTPDALFVTAFAQRGLIAEWSLSWLLPRIVGPSVALDLLFTSRRVDGSEAVALGLADTLVPHDQLLSHCREYVVGLASTSSPRSMAVMKRQVYAQLHAGLGAAEAEAQQLMLDSFGRPDFAEGVASFLERRPPSFDRLGD